MDRYHINAKGEPGLCRAQSRCPFGGPSDHYNSLQEAQKVYEERQAQQVAKSLRKTPKALAKAIAEVDEAWGPQGFKSQAQMTDQERNIADFSLSRINGYYKDKDGKPVRPYTVLLGYWPELKDTHSTWPHVELKLDHETGHLFGVSQVVKNAPSILSFSPRYINRAKVEDYGTDLEAALDRVQVLSDNTFDHLFSTKAGAKGSYGHPANGYDKDYPSRNYTEDFFHLEKATAVQNLAKGIGEAEKWNKIQRERKTQVDSLSRVAQAGYMGKSSAGEDDGSSPVFSREVEDRSRRKIFSARFMPLSYQLFFNCCKAGPSPICGFYASAAVRSDAPRPIPAWHCNCLLVRNNHHVRLIDRISPFSLFG